MIHYDTLRYTLDILIRNSKESLTQLESGSQSIIMSFLDIQDPIERERVVKEYEKMKREIRERREERIINGQILNRRLHETFHPVVKAQADMAEKIVKSLKDVNSEEEKIIPLKNRRISSEDKFGPLANAYRNRYMSRDNDIDTTFGIHFVNGEPYIANTPIKIENDDIIIYNEVYEGTPGLWNLITEKRKENLQENYDDSDLDEYAAILRQTNSLHKDFNSNSSHPRSSGSWKWKSILAPIWETWKEEEEKDGSGLIDIKHGRIWKAKRHSGKGYRKLKDGVYFRNGPLLYKF